jgi:hypothetical protein
MKKIVISLLVAALMWVVAPAICATPGHEIDVAILGNIVASNDSGGKVYNTEGSAAMWLFEQNGGKRWKGDTGRVPKNISAIYNLSSAVALAKFDGNTMTKFKAFGRSSRSGLPILDLSGHVTLTKFNQMTSNKWKASSRTAK